MPKSVRVEKDAFEAALWKMLNTPPVPKAKLPKSKKKLQKAPAAPDSR